MGLERIKVNAPVASEQQSHVDPEHKLYRYQCRRIYDEVKTVNQGLNGKVAVEVPGNNDETYQILSQPYLYKVRETDPWGSHDRALLFILAPDTIFTLTCAIDVTVSDFRRLPLNILRPYNRGICNDLQATIDKSISHAAPSLPPINPKRS